MKTRYIICALASAAALTACEDYTEHHFGKDNQLWEATQVNNHNIELLDANYADLAANADNVALALAANDDSATYRELLSVAELKYFRKGISPEEYLPAMLMQLVGTSQYHCMTAGSTINVTCRVATWLTAPPWWRPQAWQKASICSSPRVRSRYWQAAAT